MKLTFGMKVFTFEGDEIGQLKEVVIDPHSREVTHIVIKEGLFFDNARLVDVGRINSIEDDSLILKTSSEKIDDVTREYKEDAYAAVESDDELTQRIWTRPPSTPLSLVPPGIGQVQPAPDIDIPINDIALLHGANVRSSDDRNIGSVEELFTDKNEVITHIVISQGTVYSSKKLIPLEWVTDFSNNEVVLAVEAAVIKQMPGYTE